MIKSALHACYVLLIPVSDVLTLLTRSKNKLNKNRYVVSPLLTLRALYSCTQCYVMFNDLSFQTIKILQKKEKYIYYFFVKFWLECFDDIAAERTQCVR